MAAYHHRYYYRFLTVPILAGMVLQIPAAAWAGKAILNTASYKFEDADKKIVSGFTNQIKQEIVDPLGRIVGCGGEQLTDYAGFSVSVYDANLNDDLPIGLTPLPRTGPGTEFPGLAPNRQNVNPFYLSNEEPQGSYNFFLNRTAGQLEVGKRYILIVSPPPNSRKFSQRQIRIAITGRDDVAKTISYSATALDGKGIGLDGDPTSFTTTVPVNDAATQGLVLSAFGMLDRAICVGPAQPIQITKTGDRAAAEPGDTVIYRLSVRNLNTVGAQNVEVADVLPLGFAFIAPSLRAELAGSPVPITVTQNGANLSFQTTGVVIPPEGVLNIAYAVQLNPDAMRGTGENIATVRAARSDTGAILRDGPSKYKLRIRPGIANDCGTIIGRVFDDKNFDGEQQPDELGIANAVVMLDDGTRITTDLNGVFSVANVLAGKRTGVLDLTTVPGYQFAPNRVIKERNSQVRLVRLEPGGLVRMNFAVTPIAREAR